MEQTQEFLANEKIGKLIKKFSIPCVISMVVVALISDIIGSAVAIICELSEIKKLK